MVFLEWCFWNVRHIFNSCRKSLTYDQAIKLLRIVQLSRLMQVSVQSYRRGRLF